MDGRKKPRFQLGGVGTGKQPANVPKLGWLKIQGDSQIRNLTEGLGIVSVTVHVSLKCFTYFILVFCV
jgi:hypothetical protein